MKLCAPIYSLKRQAKVLSREEKIPLHEALDRIASREGFAAWSLLAAKHAETSPAERMYSQLHPGDLVLLGARPGQGKTLLALELAARAMMSGHQSVFFSLEYTDKDCLDRFQAIGVDLARFAGLFEFDGSDGICANHIVKRLATANRGTLAVIDYLQLLDQKREHPELTVQVRALRSFAKENGHIMVFIAQVDRSYDPVAKQMPDKDDVRLPNPLELELFDKMCFVHDGEITIH